MHRDLKGQTMINLLFFFFFQLVLAENLAPKGLKNKVVCKCLGHLQSYRVFIKMRLNMLLMNHLDPAVRSQMLYKCQFIIHLLILKRTPPAHAKPHTPPAPLDFPHRSICPEMQPPLTQNSLCTRSQPRSEKEKPASYFVLPGKKK